MWFTGDFNVAGWKVNENNSISAYIEGCTGDVRLTVAEGKIPPGLSLGRPYNYDGRAYFSIYGIPNTPGEYTFTLRATDDNNAYTEREFTITVTGDAPSEPVSSDSMVISGSFENSRTINNWYSDSVSVTGGVGSYTFKITDGALPPGFYIRRSNSQFYLEGIPDTAGTYTFTLRVIDQLNTYAERTFTVKISDEHSRSQAITITGSFPDAYTINTWYSESVQVSGGNPPYTFEITSDDLPPGFRIRQYSVYVYDEEYYDEGVYSYDRLYLEGIPTKPDTYKFTLQVTDSSNEYADASFDMTILGPELTTPAPSNPIAILTTNLSDAVTGRAYSDTIKAEGTVTHWSVTGGSLPPGLYLNETTGVISGTVDESAIEHNTASAAVYSFDVMAINTMSGLTEKTFTISVSEPLAFPEKIILPKARVKEAYEAVIPVNGTLLDGITFSVQSEDRWYYYERMPEGLSYNTDGRTCFITGTPKETGTHTLYLDASNGRTSAKAEVMLIIDPESDPITFTTDYLFPAVAGREYSCDIQAEGEPTSWDITYGSLPAGLSLDKSTGRISGIVDVNAAGHNERYAESYMFEVTASNDKGRTADRVFTLRVSEPLEFEQGTSFPDGRSGNSYEASVTVSGTFADGITWLLDGLPDGLEYTSGARTCVIRGTPSRAGTFTVTLLADNGMTSVSTDLALAVRLNPSAVRPKIVLPATSFTAEAGKSFTLQPEATGTTPITWAIKGDIPAGLNLDPSTGKISGIVEASDSDKQAHNCVIYSFTLTAENNGGADSANAFISVWYPPNIVTDTILPSAKLNSGYSTEIKAEGTEYGMEWEKASGTIPKGMKLTMSKNSRTVMLTGTPQSAGSSTFTLTLSNSAGSVSKAFTVTVENNTDSGTGKPNFITRSLPDGEPGVSYVAMLDASGRKPITWSKSGSFPKGLKLDKYGTISGVPTKTGAYTFTLIAKNKAGATSMQFTVTISGDAYSKPKIKTNSLPDAVAEKEYDVQLEAEGTNTEGCPMTWSLVGSKNPAGLNITEDGRITGIPKEAGKFSIKVRAENNLGSSTRSYSFKVSGFAPEILNEDMPEGTENADYKVQIQAEGSDPIKWKKSGSFPNGLSLGAKTGTITGKPTQAGTYSFKITATNKYGKDVRDFTIVVGAASVAESAVPTESVEAIPETVTDNPHDTFTQTDNFAEEYQQLDNGTAGTELDLWVVSGDEELRGEIYAPEGQPLTFVIGTEAEDVEVYIADEPIALDVEDGMMFTIPGELVYDEFVVYAVADGVKTVELYIVAEQAEE